MAETHPRAVARPDKAGRAGSKPLHPAVNRFLMAASVLVFLAGVQLFVFSERTDEFFAWTIASPLTAAFLGAGYWASVPLEFIASREKLWANARIALPGVFVFTTATLITTLMHLDVFHFDHPDARTRSVTYIWLAIYASVPILMIVLAYVQFQLPGPDPALVTPIPRWAEATLTAQAVLLLAVGALMFIAPERMSGPWPWDLTALTGRSVSAWLLGMGVGAAQMLLEGDWRRVRPAIVGYGAFGLLQVIALARYADEVEWGLAAWLYLAFLASMVAIALYGSYESRLTLPRPRKRARRSH